MRQARSLLSLMIALSCASLSAQSYDMAGLLASGSAKQVKDAIANGADWRGSYGGVPALFAAMRNLDPGVAQVLLDAGADPNEALRGGETPLMRAAANPRTADRLVPMLLAAGANAAAEQANGYTALFAAVKYSGSLAAARALLDAGAQVDAREKIDGYTPLAYAASYGKADMVDLLIGAKADLEARNSRGYTPLMVAAWRNKSLDALKALVAAGADPRAENPNQFERHAAAWCALSNPNPEVLRYFLEDGLLEPNAKDQLGLPPLNYAAMNENPEAVSVLLAAGADPNPDFGKSQSPMIIAAGYNKNPRVATILAAAWADVNKADYYGETPLMWAAKMNPNAEVVAALVKAGADPNARTSAGGYTALMEAALYNAVRNPAAITALLDAGADAALKTKDGLTALDLADKGKLQKGPVYDLLAAATRR